jgi:hypothetical protein
MEKGPKAMSQSRRIEGGIEVETGAMTMIHRSNQDKKAGLGSVARLLPALPRPDKMF